MDNRYKELCKNQDFVVASNIARAIVGNDLELVACLVNENAEGRTDTLEDMLKQLKEISEKGLKAINESKGEHNE
jgi:hypothetical protein